MPLVWPGAASHQVSRLPSSASAGPFVALEVSAVTLPPSARSVAKVSLMISRRPVQGVKLVVGNQTAFIGRQIQDEISVAPDGRVKDVHQLRDGARMFVARPKPLAVAENGGVHFRRIPPEMRTGLELGAAAEIARRHVRPVECLGRRRQRNDAPFRGAANAAFIAHPAHVRPFAHDDRVGLQAADQIIPRRVIVGLMDARDRDSRRRTRLRQSARIPSATRKAGSGSSDCSHPPRRCNS